MNKKITYSIILIIGALCLMQLSLVSASPTPVTFEKTSWIGDSIQTVTLGKTSITTVIGHGEIAGDIAGTFTWSDTITRYYDNTGNWRYTTYRQLINIQTANGQLVIETKVKWVADTPLEDVTGTWKILYGTGLMGAVSGGGTYYAWFKFEGMVK